MPGRPARRGRVPELLVRCLRLPQDRQCPPERCQGSGWTTFGERYCALGVSGAGSKEGRLEFLGDLEQLVRCLSGHGDLMRGQHDLDVRGQNSATAEAIRRFVHHPSDRCRGRIDSALRAVLAAAQTDRTHVTDTQDDSPVTVRLVVSSSLMYGTLTPC